MDKRMSAIALAVMGGLCIYAGVSGYHIDDALRVILGKKPKKEPRTGFGKKMVGTQDMPKGVPVTPSGTKTSATDKDDSDLSGDGVRDPKDDPDLPGRVF